MRDIRVEHEGRKQQDLAGPLKILKYVNER